ncbi:aspartate aminotransferase family protein [Halobacillus sp. Cin3]
MNRQKEYPDHRTMQQSAEAYARAEKVIPGGVTANIKYFDPHPIFMKKAAGSHLYDADGNHYVDYLLSYGALIHGHGHPSIKKAVIRQMEEDGTTIYGTPHEGEVEMAEQLCSLYPGMERVRYTNSGLEATLLALRVAKAYTGRPKIAKFEGHYHGGYDQVLWSIHPDEQEAGDAEEPNPVPESSGLPEYYQDHTIILPFNDLESTERILRRHAGEISALMMEPVQGGYIPADQSFMDGVRRVTKELGILLIMDEVKTGFRLSLGGAQKTYGIIPDLTALGKVLGGGFPVGAVGGAEHVMEVLNPKRSYDVMSGSSSDQPRALFHSGTYNGHPTVLAAGMATIDLLQQRGVMEDLMTKTHKLRKHLEDLYKVMGVPMKTVGTGSIFNVMMTDGDIRNYRDLQHVDMTFRKRVDERLLQLGVYTKPLNRYSMSTVHTEADIQFTVDAHEKAVKNVKG